MVSSSKVARLLALVFAFVVGFVASPARAEGFTEYTFEAGALIGLNLPYDMWGTPGTLSVLGLRGAYRVGAKGRIEAGALYQHAGPDLAYTGEAGFGYEMAAEEFNTIFNIGLHYSYFDLEVDRDEAGACVPENCLTDSGSHVGLYVGGGLQIPLSETTPLRLSMRFYQKPQLWLLLDAAIGFRF